MKIVYNNYIPFKGFLAINLFGILFVRRDYNYRTGKFEDPQLSEIVLNHERIHTRQMQELLYIPFYVLYLLFWVINLFRFRFDSTKAYYEIPFEKEAHSNDENLDYLNNRKLFNWIKI